MKISNNPEFFKEKEGTGTYLPLESQGTFIFKMKGHREWYAMASNDNFSWEVDMPLTLEDVKHLEMMLEKYLKDLSPSDKTEFLEDIVITLLLSR